MVIPKYESSSQTKPAREKPLLTKPPELEKFRAIIAAWLEYIRLEELTESKISEPEEENKPLETKKRVIWDKDVSLVGDQLIIDKNLFKEIKESIKENQKKVPSPQQKRKPDQLQIALAFPMIFQVQKNRRRFRPLFTIDISSIFAGNYRSRGWDLNQFEFLPILPNLRDLYGIEEDQEEAEILVTREGLRVFLETTFNCNFSTYYDFLQLMELPPKPLRTKPLPYLLRFNYIAYNYNLKKDLEKISKAEDGKWANPFHPAYEYLRGKPQPVKHHITFKGAWPTHPLTDCQAAALKHTQDNLLTAVIGPPGNGKTTLVLHKIAQQVVKRGLILAKDQEDINNLTLVTSTNNRAVTNVESLLTEPEKKGNFFYLAGGSLELREEQVIPKLTAALDWLKSEEFNQTEWLALKQQLLAAEKEFESYQQEDEHYQRQKAVEKKLLAQCQRELELLAQELETVQSQRQQSSLETDRYAQFPEVIARRIARKLARAWQALASSTSTKTLSWYQKLWLMFKPADKKKRIPWYQRLWLILKSLWRGLTGQTDAKIIDRLNESIREDVALTQKTPFPLQLILNPNHLEYWLSELNKHLIISKQWQQQQQLQKEKSTQLETLQQQLLEKQQQQQLLAKRLATYPEKDFFSRFYTDYHSLQIKLFELSRQLQHQEALRRQADLSKAITTYLEVFSKEDNYNAFYQLARFWRDIYRDLSLLFPVFLSTLHSLRNLFPYPDYGCIGQLIVDEAGQIPLHQVFPALVRSRQGLIIGDPRQLEPVIILSRQEQEKYCEKAFVSQGLTAIDYQRFSPTTTTAYERAAGTNGEPGDQGLGIMLEEHYRCVPVIADFCRSLCYPQLRIQTTPKPSLIGANLIAYHVAGEQTEQINQAEIEVIETLIGELKSAGYVLNDANNHQTIGIISPYRLQAEALTRQLQARYQDFPSQAIGTVHTFQGGEKSVIILSTRQCRVNDSLWFINRRPNLLNVAVSRAQELFILVGNLERLKQRGYTKKLVEYIEEWGEIR